MTDPKPQSQPQPMPQTVPQSQPQPMPQTVPQSQPQQVQAPIFQPQTVPQSQPQQVQAPISQSQPQANAYESIIAQQQAQIEALINQTNALNGQITQMVANGAQFAQQPQQVQPQQVQAPIFQPQPNFPNYYETRNPMQNFNPASLASNQDWSLEALGKEIGKPRKEE